MKYFRLYMDDEMHGGIVCYYNSDYRIDSKRLKSGIYFEMNNESFEFSYLEKEGNIWTDYLANDKGLFLVSEKLKGLMESLNTDIQFIPVLVSEKKSKYSKTYFIANVLTKVNALCLEVSDYCSIEYEGVGAINYVSKYGIDPSKTNKADVFKLVPRNQYPIFVSENFKNMIDELNITGVSLLEIRVK